MEKSNQNSEIQQQDGVLALRDPALVLTYFFNGSAKHSDDVQEAIKAIVDRFEDKLGLTDPFKPTLSHGDSRIIRFERYQWNRKSQVTLAQIFIETNQVWCVQLALPVIEGVGTIETCLAAWREKINEFSDWILPLLPNKNRSSQSYRWYWGSTRLYWAILDNEDDFPSHTLEELVQDIARSENLEQDQHLDDSRESLSVLHQAYTPQEQSYEFGTLWRLDEPAVDVWPYQTTWLLLSPLAQNRPVSLEYIFNGRFSLGEAYICKSHYQHEQYKRLTENIGNHIGQVQNSLIKLLKAKATPEFTEEKIQDAQNDLKQREKQLHYVSVAYSNLLLSLSTSDRLHLTVKINLGNFRQMAKKFRFWEHPAGQAEMQRLERVLRQIEHDQSARRATLQSFQAAIETVRTGIDLTGNRLSAELLENEQQEAKRSGRWEIILVLIGIVLSMSEIVTLTQNQFWLMLLYGSLLALFLFLVRVILNWRK